uniref:Importin subunit beta-1/Transportin-1-like TPR repeats domain-containing protein n=1 Tax=Octactis speculum TaxID=3111310 RepID=A0A7S2DCC6_9STRA|mmetsp:Transcript_4694/g.5629  ORF Transcript_4694/g.5629 Transcript_4694/m.5629 type:complete len:735 (+) Transcript_4694:202-2406(+)
MPSKDVTVKHACLKCMNWLIPKYGDEIPQALRANMQVFVGCLSSIGMDPSELIREEVCHAIVLLLGASTYEGLLPHLTAISEFMLRASADSSPQVAINACEFWPVYCECPGMRPESPMEQNLNNLLPRLIPTLLAGMVYSADEIAELEAAATEDEEEPDRVEDMRPIFNKGRSDNDDGEDADDGGGGDEDHGWTLRKCSAASLDCVATVLDPINVLNCTLPQLQTNFNSTNVWVQEAAILAFGAVADGCYDAVVPHLRDVFPYLVEHMDSPVPQVRMISCWTLSKYSLWVVEQSSMGTQHLQGVIEKLLQRVLDKNKKVQEHACSALSLLVEEAYDLFVPFLQGVLQNLMFAFHKYQARSLLVLYDTIGTLADCVRSALTPHVQTILPHLLNKWQSLSVDDRQLFPLLECLASVARALGLNFQEYSAAVLQRAMALLEYHLLQETAEAATNPDYDLLSEKERHGEFLVCSIDLLGGLADALKGNFAQLAQETNILNLLFQCLHHENPVRQATLALIGDIALNCPQFIAPALPQLIPAIIANLDQYGHRKVCSNAAWSLGEITKSVANTALFHTSVEPFIEQALQRLVSILNSETIHQNLLTNATITISQLTLVGPDRVAAHFDKFANVFVHALSILEVYAEKETAFMALCLLAERAWDPFLCCCDQFCLAAASWYSMESDDGSPCPPPAIRSAIHQLLAALNQHIKAKGVAIEAYYGQYSPDVVRYLTETYGPF